MMSTARPHRYFLIGFMGVGKTSVGRDLADRLRVPFYDLDEWIEHHSGRRIQDIFAESGEAIFRFIETSVLREIAARDPGVIATGGGTFTRAENREIMRSAGVSIWLDAPVDLILQRGSRGEHRPLWGGEDRVKMLLEKRIPYYREADLRFDLGDESPSQAAEELLRVLEALESK